MKNIGPICNINHNEEIITHDLQKAEYFNDFFVNVSEDLTKQLDPLDFSSLNTFITRVTPTRNNMSWDPTSFPGLREKPWERGWLGSGKKQTDKGC